MGVYERAGHLPRADHDVLFLGNVVELEFDFEVLDVHLLEVLGEDLSRVGGVARWGGKGALVPEFQVDVVDLYVEVIVSRLWLSL